MNDFNQYFIDKVRWNTDASTDGTSEPSFKSCVEGHTLTAYNEVSIHDVVVAISKLPDKSSAADPLPVFILKQVTDEIAPFLAA